MLVASLFLWICSRELGPGVGPGVGSGLSCGLVLESWDQVSGLELVLDSCGWTWSRDHCWWIDFSLGLDLESWDQMWGLELVLDSCGWGWSGAQC